MDYDIGIVRRRQIISPDDCYFSFPPPAAGGGGPVLFDAIHSLPSAVGSTTSFSLPTFIDIGSGTNGILNRALVAIIWFSAAVPGTASGITVTFDGAPMTLIGHVGINSDIYMFGLIAPNTGAHTLAANWTGSQNCDVAAISFVNVNQAGGATTFHDFTTNTGNSATASVTVPSVSGEAVIAAHEVGTGFSTGNGTDIGHDNGGVISAKAGNWTTAAGATTNLTYSDTSATWGSCGVSVKAA